ncbi:MAG: glycyl-radical enzyme activating protein [Clostridia bacterium]|nr:glycyl-radical enzyme activating protein [Clostridia bacterium]
MTGTIFNIQRFSLFDGPGVRTVVFFKGCPLRCIWCHNPEGLEKKPQIMFDPTRCIGCGECSCICSNGHLIQDGMHGYNRAVCEGCGKCADGCPTGSLSLAGKEMTVDEIMNEVMRDESLYRESGGGITLSGGEPLYQGDFAVALLRAAREKGINTCIETSGYASKEVIANVAKYTDYFYYDYKATGDEEHRRLCGVPSTVILNNLSLLDSLDANVTLRCPIVPGQNQTDEHITGIAKTAGEHSSVKAIHLEPFHRLGKTKAEKLGITELFDTEVPQKDIMLSYCETIEKISGKSCIIS